MIFNKRPQGTSFNISGKLPVHSLTTTSTGEPARQAASIRLVRMPACTGRFLRSPLTKTAAHRNVEDAADDCSWV